MNTSENVLENLGNEFENIEKIKSQLFEVIDLKVPAPKHNDGIEFDDPKTQLIYTNDGRYLGTTGEQYQSIQPITFLNSIVNSVDACSLYLDLGKLNYSESKNGAVIDFKVPTDVITFRNRLGNEEEIPTFINLSTGFGGKQRTEIGLYTKRLICSNGLRIIESEVELKAKHTANMNHKALIFCDELYKVVAKVQDTKQFWQAADNVEVNSNMVESFARKIAGIKEREKFADLSSRKKNIFEDVNEAIAIEFARTGTTAYGLLQGATYYTNHLASGSGAEYVEYASGRKTNDLAQKLVADLILS
jgi:hypothetical protein